MSRALPNRAATVSQAIASADIVSFDVFDTLLSRAAIRPTDVFTISKQALEARGDHLLPPNWTIARIAAEQRCYVDASVGPDITLDDIYDRLAAELHLPDALVDAAKRAEIETELQVLGPRATGRALYEEARAAGVRIFIVSDMYLPPEVIADALGNAGYEGWERLIVSGHDKLAKYNGTAFRAIRAEFPDAAIVHFGDNAEADVDRAHHEGIEAFHLPTVMTGVAEATTGLPYSALSHIPSNPNHGPVELGLSVIAALAERRMDRDHGPVEEQVGYGVLGPILVAFVQWLQHSAKRNGSTRLAFLAREGALMQRAYERYWRDEALQSDYVYASRRMINFAQIRDAITPSQLDFLVSSGVPLKVSDFIARFTGDISIADIDRAAARIGLRADSIVPGYDFPPLKSVFRALEPDLVAVARRERTDVIDYLHQVGLHESGAAVVDIGWNASIQASLKTLVNPQLQGYYFGLFDGPKTAGRAQIHGFADARRAGSDRHWIEHCVMHGIEVVELLFGNPDHPSVSTVRRGEGGFEPVYTEERLSDADAGTVRAIQRAALEFVDDYRALAERLPAASGELSPDAAFTVLTSLVRNPTPAQAAVMGSLNHDNSFGIVASPLGMPLYPHSRYRFRRSALRAEHERAWWKPGFEANLRSGAAAR
ncbi:hypothetical protein [Agromyces sp. PvR057]|uniref:hypothetical protein n=1 Tax=Agromyces sp. PvR057 TaxID=3156403 RepID=UPI000E27AB07